MAGVSGVKPERFSGIALERMVWWMKGVRPEGGSGGSCGRCGAGRAEGANVKRKSRVKA